VTTELARLEFWLPARIVNALNRRQHWTATARRAQEQRDGVAAAVLGELGRRFQLAAPPSAPKAIRFEARVGQAFDDDGLRAALKHVRDGLIDARLIDDDGPTSGHAFAYSQTPNTPRRDRGVRVVVELRKDGPDGR
jgi:hypothetical protein